MEEPIDLIAYSMNEEVFIKCRDNREIRGKLIAYDSHFNMILNNAEETHKEEALDSNNQKTANQVKRKIPMMYMRGDTIILISPVSKGII